MRTGFRLFVVLLCETFNRNVPFEFKMKNTAGDSQISSLDFVWSLHPLDDVSIGSSSLGDISGSGGQVHQHGARKARRIERRGDARWQRGQGQGQRRQRGCAHLMREAIMRRS